MAPKARGLTLVTTDLLSVAQREKLYEKGGIYSITSRILIIDFLSGLLDPSTVTGMVVLHSEKIVATSLEAFILRIYRQKNKTGFLKAFSDSPESFTSGFAPLTSRMRNLFLKRPSLWPRFHATVTQSLEGKKKAEVIELEVPMSDAMKDIQNAVMECVEKCISQLKKSNTGLDMEDWTLDSALHRNFDSIVRRQLDPVWHRTSFQTRQIVRDLTLLRSILNSVLTYDAVSFNKYLDTVLAASSPPPGSTRQTQSPWLFDDAAHVIFDTAKRRVYRGSINESEATTDTLRPVLEEQPKWAILAEILQEIERDMYFNPTITDDSNGSILIMCGDQGTCRQIREYLQTMYVQPEESKAKDGVENPDEIEPSASFMMRRRLRNYLSWKKDFTKVSAALFAENQKSINGTSSSGQKGQDSGRGGRGPPNKRRRVRGGGGAGAAPSRHANGGVYMAGDRDSHVQALMAELQPTEAETGQKGEIAADPLENMEDYYELYEMRDLMLVHPYDGDMDDQLLEEVKPRYIVMYEPDLAFIRRVEVYRSSHTDRNVRVYFMYYGGSVEEQRYLSSSRREKDSFTKLIKERGVSPPFPNHLTSLTHLTEYGTNNDARFPRHRRPPRSFPPHNQYTYCRRRPCRSNCSTSTHCSRRPRIPLLPPLTLPRPRHGNNPLRPHSRRLRPNTHHLRRAQIRPRSHLLL
jgi:DNA excision repair protein ERCC-4